MNGFISVKHISVPCPFTAMSEWFSALLSNFSFKYWAVLQTYSYLKMQDRDTKICSEVTEVYHSVS